MEYYSYIPTQLTQQIVFMDLTDTQNKNDSTSAYDFFDLNPCKFNKKDKVLLIEKLKSLISKLEKEFESAQTGKWDSEADRINIELFCALFFPIVLARFMIENRWVEDIKLQSESCILIPESCNTLKKVGDLIIHLQQKNWCGFRDHDKTPHRKVIVFSLETDKKKSGHISIADVIKALKQAVESSNSKE